MWSTSLSLPPFYSIYVPDCSPLFHPRFDLNLLVTGEHHADVDVARVGFLLPKEVVDPGLDVGAKPGGLQLLGCVLVVLPVGPRRLVTGVTFKPDKTER